ncbi:MAG: DUF3341 domain-containing protein [Endomicrobiales bacterium]|jgi:hypothetical protein
MNNDIYCLAARYENIDTFVAAVRRTTEAGYRRVETFTPFQVDGVAELLQQKEKMLPWVILCGGLFGGLSGFAMQYIAFALEYPLNIGGRPFNSWPAFIPITFELTILFSVLSAFAGFLFFNRFPELHHPAFNIPGFEKASSDSFFLCIMPGDDNYDVVRTRQFLQSTGPEELHVVETNDK